VKFKPQFAEGASCFFRQFSEQKHAGRVGLLRWSPAAVQIRMDMHPNSSRSVSSPRSVKGLITQQVGDEGPLDPV
jgi:hypothetical protein